VSGSGGLGPSDGSAQAIRVSNGPGGIPVYIWILVPLGLLLLVATSWAVFEPEDQPKPLAVVAEGRRQRAVAKAASARELSALVSRAGRTLRNLGRRRGRR